MEVGGRVRGEASEMTYLKGGRVGEEAGEEAGRMAGGRRGWRIGLERRAFLQDEKRLGSPTIRIEHHLEMAVIAAGDAVNAQVTHK